MEEVKMTELEKQALRLADGDTCHYDHHGHCQTHFLHDKPCPMEIINRKAKEIANVSNS